MQGHIQQESWRSVLPHPPYSLDFPSFSIPTKCSEWQKFSQDQVKTLVENILSLKPSQFYLRRTNKRTDKWQEVIQNNGEYTTDSHINYIF